MVRKITSDMVLAYSLCHRKAFLIEHAKEEGEFSGYIGFMKGELKKSRELYFKDTTKGGAGKYGKNIETEELAAYVDVISYVETAKTKKEKVIPTLLIGTHKYSKQHKLQLAFIGYILYRQRMELPTHGYIVNRVGLRNKVKIAESYKELERILIPLRERGEESFFEQPAVILNKHCPLCQFKSQCQKSAEKEDHLSLLGSIHKKEIDKFNQKGIFTVKQLSYTFRARKNKNNKYSRPRSYPLQAQALRDQQIYVYGIPRMQESKIEIFFDIEGIPDQSFQYLIGVLVQEDQNASHHYFWADTKDEELRMLRDFLAFLEKYEGYTLFHYGTYETRYLKRMAKRLDGRDLSNLELVLSSCFNVLSIIYSNIYFPSYSNSLKSIANSIGFKWSDPMASGLQSIAWRMQWELSRCSDLKESLITYNREDCMALLAVRQAIGSIINSKEALLPYEIVSNNSYSENPSLSFVRKNFALPEIPLINKWSYFDYQKDRVHIRRKKIKKSSLKRKKSVAILQSKVNKHEEIISSKCPKCRLPNIENIKSLSKVIIDLKFFESGAKRWITEFTTNEYLCRECGCKFVPNKFKAISRGRYGHHLKSWVIYQHIVNRESFRQIETNCLELFNFHLPSSSSHVFKDYVANYYKSTYQKLLDKILNSHVVYIDETPFKLKSGTVYAWVLTNGYEVISLYRPTREGEFLKDLFSDYAGVVVSDGYSAYDSLNVRQQRCLIHIIRDFNHDLLKNPFDTELKGIAQGFTTVLQSIIQTIEKFGLKKYYLNKHKRAALSFVETVVVTEYRSDVALQYKKRIKKSKTTLFEFLNHDNVSWNNTNAEHAIKLLSTHRNLNIKFIHESKMDVYLRVLSLYQTCEYLGASFLQFMLSGEEDLDKFMIGTAY